MGSPETAKNIYTPGNFFHCIPVGELAEFNTLNNVEWEKRAFGPKAFVERFLIEGAGFFPDNLITPRTIVEANDIHSIRQLLQEGINQKYAMGVRTISDQQIFSGNRLPWEMEINTPEKIDMFIHGLLPIWQNDSENKGLKINQLILMKNLPEIGTKKSNEHQFVARLRWETIEQTTEIVPYQLVLEMISGTNKLRDLDLCMEDKQINKEELFRYIGRYTPTRAFLDANIQIGTNYFTEQISNPGLFELTEGFTFPQSQRTRIQPDHMRYIDTLLSFLHKAAVDPNTKLLERLDFFSSMGLSSIEIQGYADQHKNIARIYGLRGPKDETETGLKPYVRQC